MKIKVVEGTSVKSFESSMEFYLNQLTEKNQEIIDIKFGGCGGFVSTSDGGYYEYSAMIIYRDR